MIVTKHDLHYYLAQDKKALTIKHKRPKWFGDDIWKYQRILRKYEYYSNSGATLRKWLYRYLHKKKGMQLGTDPRF